MAKSIEIKNFSRCPECGSHTVFSDFRGEEACSQCGLVVDEGMFSTSHNGRKRFSDNEKIKSPFTIGNYKNTPQMGSTKINLWSDHFQINLNEAQVEINRICNNLDLPRKVKNDVKYLYIKALKKKLTRGRTIIGMVCACIYYSCKNEYPRSIEEIAQHIERAQVRSKDPKTHIKSCYKILVKELRLKHQSGNITYYVPRFVFKAGFGYKIINLTMTFLEHYKTEKTETHFIARDPRGIAAAAIYLTVKKNGQRLTQLTIAKIAGITDSTLIARIKELKKMI